MIPFWFPLFPLIIYYHHKLFWSFKYCHNTCVALYHLFIYNCSTVRGEKFSCTPLTVNCYLHIGKSGGPNKLRSDVSLLLLLIYFLWIQDIWLNIYLMMVLLSPNCCKQNNFLTFKILKWPTIKIPVVMQLFTCLTYFESHSCTGVVSFFILEGK